jgi:hypothetical protein
MFRTFIHSTKKSRRAFIFSLPHTSVAPLSVDHKQRISSLSTSEDAPKILTSADVKKMLVADLKIELKTRGASMQGKKGDLVERLLKIIENEKSSHVASQTTITPQSGFREVLQKLDLVLSQKNFHLFEETMKEMETAIRSMAGIFLSAEQKEFVFDKLRVWSEMDGIPSESIASVLKSAGYLGLSLQSGDQKSEILANSIIEKYLKAENKSTRSIAIFLTALNKIGAKWKELNPQTQDQINVLLTNLSEAENLDPRSVAESLMGIAKLGKKWETFPTDVRERYLSRVHEMKPILDAASCHVLIRAFTSLIGGKRHQTQKDQEDLTTAISQLSWEGLKLIFSAASGSAIPVTSSNAIIKV